jgi:hypothetical protein
MERTTLFLAVTVGILGVGAVFVGAGEDPTTHPDPLPLSTIRSDHPRLWFNSDNVHLLRQRWTDPVYADIVGEYVGENDAISLALEGLATHNAAKCSEAASTVGYEYRRQGDKEAGHVDSISLVFDWCYEYLDADERSDLISKIENLRDEHKNHSSFGIRSWFSWHESFWFSSFAYIASVLAIEGEPDVTSELREAQNVLQNLQEIGDEVRGDGGYREYFYQGTVQTLPLLMWSYATDMDFAARSGFAQNLAGWAVHKLSPTGRGFVRGPGDDVAYESGYMGNVLGAGGFYLLASHFGDPVAQWLGNHLKDDFGQRTHWERRGPSFISLVHYDPDREAMSADQAGMPLTALYDRIGMVHTRSSWGTGHDVVHAWFYNGPATAHSSESQNHFTIWRGNDPLIMRGGNYLGTSCTYKSHYHKESVSNNSLLFSPIGSSTPDDAGSQTLGEASAEKFPVAERVGSWSGQHKYRGEIVYFEDGSQYTIVSGDATPAYEPDWVDSYVRDFVYLKPAIFLIRDRFNTTGVATIRSLVHSRNKPIFVGTPTVVEGDASAGILELDGDGFRLQNGFSEVDFAILWPDHPMLRFVGGAGYEGYADGYNADPETDSQDWLHGTAELEERTRLIEGQWRTEVEIAPSQVDGNLVQALYVSGRNPSERPAYSTRTEGEDLIVNITHDRRTWVVVFPENGVPTVDGRARWPHRVPVIRGQLRAPSDLTRLPFR